ncbi:DUF3413 domain-containing protein [Pseudoalteromonas sp. SSDWG2]|uniref:DUF3413 domain-containing protein n=1 Tax=Pseudoalteromonas sp. SSDWG2 TaxID=3139391 RepID=UPI003BA89826
MNLATSNQFSSKASQLLAWGHWFTLANIVLALLISTSYLFADAAPTTAIGAFYMAVTWLSHTAFITFLAFVLTVFPLSLIFPYPRHIRGMASVIATLGMTWLCVDAFVYYNLGYHLNYDSLREILSLFWRNISNTPALSTLLVTVLIALILAYQLLVSNYTWHHLAALKQKRIGKRIYAALVVCFALSHSIHIWADAELKFDVTKQDNMLPLSYPTTAKSLLAKNDLLDLEVYEQAHQVNVSAPNVELALPAQLPLCEINSNAKPVDIRLFSSKDGLQRFLSKAPNLRPIAPILHPVNTQDTLFNVMYGLPSYYRQSFTAQNTQPLWVRPNMSVATNVPQFDFINTRAANASVQVSIDSLDAINGDAITFAFSIQNEPSERITAINKLWSSETVLSESDHIVQPQDLIATVLNDLWSCPELAQQALIANAISSEHQTPDINYSQGVFIILRKDRITLLSSDGSYKHISATQGFALEQELNLPLLVQGLKQLKRFSKH